MFVFVNFLWILFAPASLYSSDYLLKKCSWLKEKKIVAADLATPFLFVGLHGLSRNIFPNSIFPYFLISVLLLGMSVTGFLAYAHGEIDYPKLVKIFWRMTFVFTFFVYLLLVIANIVVAIQSI